MEMPIKHIFNLANDRTLAIPDNFKIIFLCGVLFDGDNDGDKRIVLRDYLKGTAGNYPIILEEHFSNTKVYNDIDLSNLYDVETLVACFANATIIIHESISTGAELGMLASNKSTASKLLVLHPDRDSVEEDKISAFIWLAYYAGKEPVLSKKHAISFSPLLKKVYGSNDKYTYHTAFPNKLSVESRTRNGIDEFLKNPDTQPLSALTFQKAKFNSPTTATPDMIDYHKDGPALRMYISSMALRSLLFSLLSLDSVKDQLESATSISGVIAALRTNLEKVLLETAREKLGENPNDIIIQLKGIELSTFHDRDTQTVRKAIGLFAYLLKAMGYLATNDNKEFKLTRSFNLVRSQFSSTIDTVTISAFKKVVERSGA